MRFEWFYLVIGFALYFVIIKGRGRKKDKNTWLFALKLTLALILLLAINYCAEALLWKPTGRGDLQTLSLLLWAVVIDWIMNGPGKERGEIQTVVGSFLLALIAFSLWTIRKIEGA
ncbi:MAG: hypothetical protein HY447_03270, partial [Candidatus Omnitrophica bacterium]|nr:hypothetical protein [Candidatus Omnitrophota bacterium]